MATVPLTYDIDSKHVAFKKALKKLGYADYFVGRQRNNLPNTTMCHAHKTAEEARDEAKTLSDQLSVKLERCFAIEFSSWSAIAGAAHAE